MNTRSSLVVRPFYVVMDVIDPSHSIFDIVSWASLSWGCVRLRGYSHFMEHLLLSGFSPVRIIEVKGATHGLSHHNVGWCQPIATHHRY